MRLIKMLGLAAVTAMAAMAFVGASTASADAENIVLCKNAELVCKSPFPNPTTIVAHAENPKLLATGIGTVECEKSLAEVKLLNKLDKLIEGHIETLTFEGNCHLGGTGCTVTVASEHGSLSFTKIGALEASAVAVPLYLGPEKTEPMLTNATVKCGFFINCTYSDAGEPLLKAHSLENGETHLLANETVLSEGKGFLCPETSKWDANYLTLGKMWIES